jgi:hypothetical protein
VAPLSRGRWIAAGTLLSLALAPAHGIASNPPPIPLGFRFAPPQGAAADPKVQELRELYENAHVSFLAGRYLDAAAQFDAGYAQGNMVAFLYNAAVAWEKAGNLEQAIDRYAQYLIRSPTSDDFEDVEKRVDALRNAIEQQTDAQVSQVMETKGVAIITSTPPGSEIRLDHPEGPVFAHTPYQGTLPTGAHTLYVSARGFKPTQRAFPDNAGKVLIGHFALSEEYFLGQLEIKSAVAGADIFLRMIADASGAEVPESDGAAVPVGKTPFSNQLAPGTYELRIQKRGYQDLKLTVEVAQGKVRTVDAKLDLVESGVVRFDAATPASEGASVYLGESHLCDIPCEAPLPPGEHVVNVQMDKKKTLSFELPIRRGDEIQVGVTMEPKTKRAGAYVAGTFMLASVGVGTYFALEANKTAKSIDSDLAAFNQIDDQDPRRQKGMIQAIVADSLFGVGVITGALTLYYAFRTTGVPSSGEINTDAVAKRRFRPPLIAPSVGKNHVGMAAQVRF